MRVASGLHHIVIFNAGNCLPGVRKSNRIKVIGYCAEIDFGILPERCRIHGTPDRAAQAVVLQDIKPRAANAH